MWAQLTEWCADIFGLTCNSRLRGLVVGLAGVLLLTLLLGARWGWEGLAPPGVLVLLAISGAMQVAQARHQLWRTSCLRIDARGQAPEGGDGGRLLAPTSVALRRLAWSIDAVRRGRYAPASEEVPLIDRDLLRPEELQLLDAVRAMVSLGLGDDHRAAQQAVTALPTGSDELDTCLGRAVVADAWGNHQRLRAIDAAWAKAGVAAEQTTSLARLRKLVHLRIETTGLDTVGGAEARALSGEARAIGDDDLAAELESRGRPTAYR